MPRGGGGYLGVRLSLSPPTPGTVDLVVETAPGLTAADPGLQWPAISAFGGGEMKEQAAGQCAGSDGRGQWSMLLRGAAAALVTAFAFAARADALIYRANANTHTIGRATFDTKIVDQSFIQVAGGFPNGVAVYG